MNDPAVDLAIFYVYWFVIGYLLLRGWRVLSRWLIWLNWRWHR